MVVKALYTDIPNNEGIAAVKLKQDNYTKKTVATKVITTFLARILTLSNSMFDSKFYLQIKGCAMGTICTPTYANIFMSEFKERYIYPPIKNKSNSYLRFINYIFMIWTISEIQFKFFINEINRNNHSIKFIFKFSKEKIKFLDILVHRDHSNPLQTTFYKNPTDHQNYLHANCAHPLSVKSIPCSQALRIKRVSQYLMNTKSVLMFWLNDLWKKGSKKT